MQKKCNYCNQTFECDSGRWFSNHVRWCKDNPKSSASVYEFLPSDRENIIMKFKIWLENITRNYDINSFVKLPWNWNLMIKDKVLQPFFYYAKENYINGKPEVMTDDEISIITFVNLKQIPQDELSKVNLHTGNPINIQSFLNFCKNPLGWYDEKIDQIYDSMKILGKTPEYYGGKDIR